MRSSTLLQRRRDSKNLGEQARTLSISLVGEVTTVEGLAVRENSVPRRSTSRTTNDNTTFDDNPEQRVKELAVARSGTFSLDPVVFGLNNKKLPSLERQDVPVPGALKQLVLSLIEKSTPMATNPGRSLKTDVATVAKKILEPMPAQTTKSTSPDVERPSSHHRRLTATALEPLSAKRTTLAEFQKEQQQLPVDTAPQGSPRSVLRNRSAPKKHVGIKSGRVHLGSPREKSEKTLKIEKTEKIEEIEKVAKIAVMYNFDDGYDLNRVPSPKAPVVRIEQEATPATAPSQAFFAPLSEELPDKTDTNNKSEQKDVPRNEVSVAATLRGSILSLFGVDDNDAMIAHFQKMAVIQELERIEDASRNRLAHPSYFRPQLWFHNNILAVLRQADIRTLAHQKRRMFIELSEPNFRAQMMDAQLDVMSGLRIEFEEGRGRIELQWGTDLWTTQVKNAFDHVLFQLMEENERYVDVIKLQADLDKRKMVQEYIANTAFSFIHLHVMFGKYLLHRTLELYCWYNTFLASLQVEEQKHRCPIHLEEQSARIELEEWRIRYFMLQAENVAFEGIKRYSQGERRMMEGESGEQRDSAIALLETHLQLQQQPRVKTPQLIVVPSTPPHPLRPVIVAVTDQRYVSRVVIPLRSSRSPPTGSQRSPPTGSQRSIPSHPETTFLPQLPPNISVVTVKGPSLSPPRCRTPKCKLAVEVDSLITIGGAQKPVKCSVSLAVGGYKMSNFF